MDKESTSIHDLLIQDSRASPDFGPVGVSRCGLRRRFNTNSAATVSANFEDIFKMTSSAGVSDCTTLLNRIKERLLMMDLINNMDKAKELTQFVLTHQAIPREDKEEFTCWLQALQRRSSSSKYPENGCNAIANASTSNYGVALPPQVTISGVSGNTVQYNALHSPTVERTSRPWRSNSLTPPSGNLAMNSSNPGSSSSSNPHHEWIQFQAKGRSHSLTYVRDTINSNSEVSHSILCPTTSAGTAASTFDEKEIEEMIRNLQEGSGMREIREWLKSLRLHKYTKILLELSYEELLQLNDEVLERKNVTLGARGKILKYIGHIKERPRTIKKLAKDIEDVSKSNDSDGLVKVLRDLEAIVLMPLKPYHRVTRRSSGNSVGGIIMISSTKRSHHDSGSDSGTEQGSLPEVENSEGNEDIPGQIFEIFKSISTEIFVKEYTNHEVVTVFACLLEKCCTREAYSPCQKQLIAGWLQKLKTLWNPPHIKKATDYKKRPNFRSENSNAATLSNGLSRRPSYHRNTHQSSANPLSVSSVLFNKGIQGMMTQVEKEDPLGVSFSPRRSMPEIKSANPNFVSQLKRNSYQEESRINLDGFGHHSSVPTSFISSYRNSFSGHPSRRESSDSGFLMSLPESRRDSEVDSFATPGGHCINTNYGRIAMDLRRDSEDFLSSIHQHPLKFAKPAYRRDSGTSEDYLTVESALLRNSRNVGVIGQQSAILKNPGSMSSGCASDGSTDSLLEQDLHNLSLAVTQQALD